MLFIINILDFTVQHFFMLLCAFSISIYTLTALMGNFRELIMQNSQTPGVPKEHKRLMELERFISFHIFSYIKFYDHSFADDHDDNFYLEREWRVIGNVKFDLCDIETVFMPKQFSQRFRTDCPAYESQLTFV